MNMTMNDYIIEILKVPLFFNFKENLFSDIFKYAIMCTLSIHIVDQSMDKTMACLCTPPLAVAGVRD